MLRLLSRSYFTKAVLKHPSVYQCSWCLTLKKPIATHSPTSFGNTVLLHERDTKPCQSTRAMCPPPSQQPSLPTDHTQQPSRSTSRREILATVPNVLTAGRMAITPAIGYFIVSDQLPLALYSGFQHVFCTSRVVLILR